MPKNRNLGYTKADLAAVDFPELTDEELKRLRPAAEVLPPNLYRKLTRGPQKTPTKVPVSIRLDADVVAKLKAGGSRWQSTANSLLRKAVGLETPKRAEAPRRTTRSTAK